MQTDLYSRLKNKEVMIVIKHFHSSVIRTHEGKVVGSHNIGVDVFLELDNGSLVNTRYIESIEVTE